MIITHKKLLLLFLSNKGLSAQFLINIKTRGRKEVKNVEELIDYMHKHRHPIRQAIYLAFFWDTEVEYWKKISDEWKKFIKEYHNEPKRII